MPLSSWVPGVDKQGRELAKHGDTAFPIACYYDALSIEPVDWHWHEEMECAFVTEGSCTFLIGAQRCDLQTGEGIFIIPGVVHAVADPLFDPTTTEPPNCRLHSMCFHPRLVGGSPESTIWQKYVQPLVDDLTTPYVRLSPSNPWHQQALDAIEDTWQACVMDVPGYELRIRNRLSDFIWLLISNRETVKAKPSEKAIRDAERIKIMLNHIHVHYGEDLDTASIAQSANISVSECLRCFHNTIHTTPIQYLKQYRIQRAARLLTSTHMKIVDIGLQCGFQEMSYFSKIFRQSMGCTPREYRANERSVRE